MKFHLLSAAEQEKFMVLASLYTSFAGAFLIVAAANFQ
jgi:hypothetical protein